MSFIYRPAIHASGYGSTPKTLSFPQSVIDCTASFSYQGQEHRIPLKTGGLDFGTTEGPVSITIAGETGHDPDGIITYYGSDTEENRRLWEAQMWNKLIAIRTLINAHTDDNPLELFFIYDTVGPQYIKFKSVVPRGFNFNLGDGVSTYFTYDAAFVANDTTIYTTAPGA